MRDQSSLTASPRGFALPWVSIASVTSLTLLLAAFVLVHAAMVRMDGRTQGAQLRSLTLSGVHFALAKLNHDRAYGGLTTDGWEISVATPSSGPPPKSPDFRLETDQAEDWRRISVTARTGIRTHQVEAVAMALYQPRYPAGILTTGLLQLRGVEVDSFDARRGDYRATRQMSHGNVWSFGDIQMSSGASNSVAGDCRAFGRLYVDEIELTRRVSGSTASIDERYDFMPIPIPVDALPLLVRKGETKHLASGRYRIDRLTLTSDTRLICDGDVEIYAGNVSIAPLTLITLASDPMALRLIVQGSQVEVGCPFTGIVDAPSARVILNGAGDFTGAVLASTAVVGPDIKFHFDRSLPRRTRGPLTAWILAGWKKL